MTKYEENAFTSLRELPDPLERPDELRLTPQSKPTPIHIHFLGTEALLTAPEDKLHRLFKQYAKSKQTFFLRNLRSRHFPPSSALMGIVPFIALLGSSPPQQRPLPPASGSPFPWGHLTFPSTPEQQAKHNQSRPQSLIITQSALPCRQDSKSPSFNDRSLYFHLSTRTPAEPVLWLILQHAPVLLAGFTLHSAWESRSVTAGWTLVRPVPSLFTFPLTALLVPSLGHPMRARVPHTSLEVAESSHWFVVVSLSRVQIPFTDDCSHPHWLSSPWCFFFFF